MTDWVRLWHDMPTDPKWRAIARKSGQPLPCVIALFNLLMCNASANADERGRLRNWDNEDSAAALDMETEAVAAIMDAMQGKVLDGDKLTGWEKRQPKREDNSAGRVAEYRKRKAEAKSADVTQCNAPETETETETDKITAKAVVDLAIDETAAEPDDDKLKPEHVVEHWNDVASKIGKPVVRNLTPERRQTVRARIAQYSIDDFVTVFGNVQGSAFLRDAKACGFDWTMKKSNFQKVLEGNYNG